MKKGLIVLMLLPNQKDISDCDEMDPATSAGWTSSNKSLFALAIFPPLTRHPREGGDPGAERSE